MGDDAFYGVGRPVTNLDPRCWRCDRRLAEYLTPPFSIRCRGCKAQNKDGAPPTLG